MRRYLVIYKKILTTTIQRALEYRLNALVQSLYGIVFMLAILVSLNVMFSHADSIAGWNRSEALLLFSVMNMMFVLFMVLIIEGIRRFMQFGVSRGEVDMFLTKPVNTQFLVSFFYPDVSSVVMLFCSVSIFFYAMYLNLASISMSGLFSFMLTYSLCCAIFYFYFASLAVSAFYITKSRQILEMGTKMSDFGFYPTNMFPRAFQVISFTIVPIAFFGYVPTLFLLSRGSWQLFLFCIFILVTIFIINQVAWKKGLKAYSSASS